MKRLSLTTGKNTILPSQYKDLPVGSIIVTRGGSEFKIIGKDDIMGCRVACIKSSGLSWPIGQTDWIPNNRMHNWSSGSYIKGMII